MGPTGCLPLETIMPSSDSFNDFMDRLRAKDEAAAAELFNHFVSRLIGLARLRLDEKLRRVADSEDIVQSVFKSFFVRLADGKLDLEDWDSLWSILAVI